MHHSFPNLPLVIETCFLFLQLHPAYYLKRCFLNDLHLSRHLHQISALIKVFQIFALGKLSRRLVPSVNIYSSIFDLKNINVILTDILVYWIK